MDKKNFEGLLKGIRETGKIMRGEMAPSRVFVFSPNEIRKIRSSLNLSQKQFSRMVFVSVKTLQNWEQGRRQPKGPAVALLMILKKDPKHAIKALH
jgi:putative transcriptional regulator